MDLLGGKLLEFCAFLSLFFTNAPYLLEGKN